MTLELFPEEPLKSPGEVHPFDIYDRFECPGCLLEYPDDAKDPDCILCEGMGETTFTDIIDKMMKLDKDAADVSRIRARLARNDEWMETYAQAIDKVCDNLDAICLNATDDELRVMVQQEASGLRGWKGIACINEILNKELK